GIQEVFLSSVKSKKRSKHWIPNQVGDDKLLWIPAIALNDRNSHFQSNIDKIKSVKRVKLNFFVSRREIKIYNIIFEVNYKIEVNNG
ncbi:MAG TPA: hypothetical protein PLC43_07090, partial [Caldisericia bacterium]|nr:hypothetical protein [Caldisericia bacterium]